MSKYKIIIKTLTIKLLCLFTLFSCYALATPGTPSYTSASVSGSSITVSWGNVSGASHYRLRFSDNGGGWTEAGGNYSGNSKTWNNFTGTLSNRRYSMKACIGSNCGSWSSSSGSITYPVPPPTPSSPSYTSASVSGSSITISWGTVSSASHYRLRYRDNGGSWIESGGTYSGGSVTSSNVTDTINNRSYSMQACISNNCSQWTDPSNAITYLPKPSSVSASVSGSSITVSWGAVTGASHYRLSYSDNGGSSWTEANTNYEGSTKTWNNVSDSLINRSYSIKACIGNNCGQWANSSGAITYLPKPSSTSASVNGSSITISWSPISNADHYRLRFRENGGLWTESGTTYSTNSISSSNNTETIDNRSYSIQACIGTYCGLWSSPSNIIDYTPPAGITLSINATATTSPEYTVQWNSQLSGNYTYILEQNINDQTLPVSSSGADTYLWVEIAEVSENGSKAITNNLDGEYTYRVKACDLNGNCNLKSNTLTQEPDNNYVCPTPIN